MSELFTKLVDRLLGQSDSGTVTLLLIVVGYLAWKDFSRGKQVDSLINDFKNTIERMQADSVKNHTDDRQALLEILDKYHQSQLTIRDAITEVRVVLSAISSGRH